MAVHYGAYHFIIIINFINELTALYRWLDETPTGRIITRCTQDIRAIDGPVPQMFVSLLDFACGIVTKLGAIVLFTPLFLLPGVGVAIFGLYFGNMYLKAQLSVKRETRYFHAVQS